MYKLIKIDESFSDEKWQELFEVRQSQNAVIPFGCKTLQDLKDECLSGYSDADRLGFAEYAVLDSLDRIIGEYYCYGDDGVTENLGQVLRLTIYLFPEQQTDDVLSVIFNQLLNDYDNSLKIRLISDSGFYDHWAEKWGGIFKIHLECFKLKYSDIDKDKFTDWAESAKSNNPDFRLRFCETKDLNDNEMNEYLTLHNTGLDNSIGSDPKAYGLFEKYNFKYQIPLQLIKSDIEVNKKNGKHICQMVLLYDPVGQIAGFTQVGIDFKKPKEYLDNKPVAKYLCKGMTYVRPEYRGRGLGKWMNSELYLKLIENFKFDEIETEMVHVNRYIQNINREFGYKRQDGIFTKEYIFELSEIKILLNK